MAQISNPSPGETETRRSLGVTAQPVRLVYLLSKPVRNPVSDMVDDARGITLEVVLRPPHACTHMCAGVDLHVCTCVYTRPPHDAVNALLTKFRPVKFNNCRIRG